MIKSPFPGEFDALARQYWNTWNEMLGQPGGFQGWAPPGGVPGGMNERARFTYAMVSDSAAE